MKATRTPIRDTYGIRRCARCGFEREARPTSVLCKDCRDVLSREERSAWTGETVPEPVQVVALRPSRLLTECHRGHTLDDAYVAYRKDGRIRRNCRTCMLERKSRRVA